MSTVSASPSATVMTSSATPIRKPLSCSVLSVSVNAKVSFSSSVPGADDKVTLNQTGSTENKDTRKVFVEVGDLSSLTTRVFPTLDEAQEMSITQLSASRVPFGVPTNFEFVSVGGHASAIRAIACSADGSQYGVTVAGKSFCTLHDVNPFSLILNIQARCEVTCCCVSRDSKFIATTTSESIILWDLNNGKRLREVPFSHETSLCGVTEESDLLIAALPDGAVRVWDAKSCDQLSNFTRHTVTVTALSVSRKNQQVASGCLKGSLFVWNLQSGETKFELNFHTAPIIGTSFSRDGLRLSSLDRENVAVWDTFTGTLVMSRSIRASKMFTTAAGLNDNFAPSFTTCCFGAANVLLCATSARQVVLMDPNIGSELLSLSTRGVVTATSISWNGDIILLGDNLGNVYKLQLFFSAKHVQFFNLTSRPPAKEKSKFD